MPLWNIYHPARAYDEADKAALSRAITQLYPILPTFYVGVVFQAVEPASFFIGGVPRDNFVRVSVDHIARQFADDATRERWLRGVRRVFTPFTEERGLDWELHVDETPFHLWLIQGMRPPLPDSDGEKLWIAENRPVPLPVPQA